MHRGRGPTYLLHCIQSGTSTLLFLSRQGKYLLFALLQLVVAQVPDHQSIKLSNLGENKHYEGAKMCVEDLALYLKPLSGGKGVASLNQSVLSCPLRRKLVTLINCQLVEEESHVRAMRAARSLGERTVTELILQHQNPQPLSVNLWAAVRVRGCQFLGPGKIDHYFTVFYWLSDFEDANF